MTTTDNEPAQHPKRLANPKATFVHAGDKRLKKIQKAAWDAGWWPAEKKSGIMWQSPDGRHQVMLHRTDSDHRAYDNAVAQFRAAGLKL